MFPWSRVLILNSSTLSRWLVCSVFSLQNYFFKHFTNTIAHLLKNGPLASTFVHHWCTETTLFRNTHKQIETTHAWNKQHTYIINNTERPCLGKSVHSPGAFSSRMIFPAHVSSEVEECSLSATDILVLATAAAAAAATQFRHADSVCVGRMTDWRWVMPTNNTVRQQLDKHQQCWRHCCHSTTHVVAVTTRSRWLVWSGPDAAVTTVFISSTNKLRYSNGSDRLHRRRATIVQSYSPGGAARVSPSDTWLLRSTEVNNPEGI